MVRVLKEALPASITDRWLLIWYIFFLMRRNSLPLMTESAGKILMLVENHFPDDPRVRNECELLREHGYAITVICVKGKGERGSENIGGIHVYRIPEVEVFKKVPLERQSP